jgi:hypothetical protein
MQLFFGRGLWVSFALLLMATSNLRAERAEVATFVYPPLTLEDGSGYSTELVQRIFAEQKIEVNVSYVPVRRAIDMAVQGQAFFLGGPNTRTTGPLMNFIPIFELQTTLLYDSRRLFFSPYQGPKAMLQGRSIGTLQGYEDNPLVQEFDMRVEKAANMTGALRMLQASRFDFLPCIKSIECPLTIDMARKNGMTLLEIPLVVGPKLTIGLIYRMDNPSLASQAEAFRSGLAILKRRPQANQKVRDVPWAQ